MNEPTADRQDRTLPPPSTMPSHELMSGAAYDARTLDTRAGSRFSIDLPNAGTSVRLGDPVSVHGWYFDSKLQPASKVIVSLGDRTQECSPVERLDVVEHFSHLGAVPNKVGFRADIDCDSSFATLKIEAITQNGWSLVLDHRPVNFKSAGRTETPLPPVTIVIPTLNGGELFRHCLKAIRSQRYAADIQLIVIDSGSNDGTERLAESFGAEVIRINRNEFHHSRTRQRAIAHARHEFVVFSVQDAIPRNHQWLNLMVEALRDNPEAVACYGRQEPHEDADLFARFETLYHSRYLGSRPRLQAAPLNRATEDYGTRLYRCRFDNVCAIYRRSALLDCPFPEIPFGEDMAWAMAVQDRGRSVAYEPRICVRHSHNRPPEYRLRRSFVDTVCCARILGLLPASGPLLSSEAQLNEINDFAAQAKSLHGELVHDGHFEAIASEAIHRCLHCKSADSVTSFWIHGMRDHVAHLLASIARDFPSERVGAYRSCLDQTIASAHGTTLGNIYASHEAARQMPGWLEVAMSTYFHGV